MRKQNGHGIKLRHLLVRNYKVLDELEMDFPPPRMDGDPDIMIMGSKNGLGKTSVLESCALLFLGAVAREKAFELRPYREMPVNLGELLVRAGAVEAAIEGTFSYRTETTRLTVVIERSGHVKVHGGAEYLRHLVKESAVHPMEMAERIIAPLAALNAEPLVLSPLLYFHSYRKVQEGNANLGSIAAGERHLHDFGGGRYDSGLKFSISTFKREVLQAMMGRADLFEGPHEEEAGGLLDKLNELIRHFAGGTIAKLRPSEDGTIEFRITPTEGGGSFSFDGLSSGQKEIISTLFLIFRYSIITPAIVLIDEPELHLNAEWHHSFIRQLHTLAPRNQYIIATHSEDVFASVPEDRRLLLQVEGAAVR